MIMTHRDALRGARDESLNLNGQLLNEVLRAAKLNGSHSKAKAALLARGHLIETGHAWSTKGRARMIHEDLGYFLVRIPLPR